LTVEIKPDVYDFLNSSLSGGRVWYLSDANNFKLSLSYSTITLFQLPSRELCGESTGPSGTVRLSFY